MKIKILITEEVLRKTAGCGILPEEAYTNPMKLMKGMHVLDIVAIKNDLRENCAISYAVDKIFPGAMTSNDQIELNGEGRNIQLPQIAQDFIREFDTKSISDRLEMKPISFEIEVPSKVIDQIGIGDIYKILSESKTLELVSI